MIEVLEAPAGDAIGLRISGKLHDADYQKFVPMVDQAIAEHGKTRILVQFHDFEGWDAKALWDDIKFATTHCTKIERIAMVGETQWQKYMTVVCKPFSQAKIQYFDVGDLDAAWQWIAAT